MNKKHLLAIAIILLVTTLLFTAYNSNMHVIRPRGVAVASGSGVAMILGLGGGPETFECVIERATDVVVAEFVARRPFG